MMHATRKEALLNKATQYFTGRPCIKGHIDARRVKTGECLKCRSLALIKWRQKNPQKVKQHNDTQYLKYETEKYKWHARNKKYVQNNKALINARTVAYQLAKLNRMPLWADKNKIKELYKLAQIKTKETGFSWHVDHIIPLQGKLVSGLHVSNNLQVISGIDNIKKHNKYEVA